MRHVRCRLSVQFWIEQQELFGSIFKSNCDGYGKSMTGMGFKKA